jgi:hypothetical protein
MEFLTMKKAFKFGCLGIVALFLIVVIALIIDISNDDEQTANESAKTTEEQVKKEPEENKEPENELSAQQQETIEALTDFPKFINAYKELGEDKTPTWDNYLSGQKVTWTGVVMETGSSQVWVWGAGDYNGQTWNDVSTAGNEAYNVFVADFSDGAPAEIKAGDQVTVEGVLESRGDYDLNYHWKLYESTIKNVIPSEKEESKVESETQTTTSNETTKPAAPEPVSESFTNCDEMRKVYPNGVDSNHPAYASKHDRDKDGFACERS